MLVITLRLFFLTIQNRDLLIIGLRDWCYPRSLIKFSLKIIIMVIVCVYAFGEALLLYRSLTFFSVNFENL